MLTSSWVYKTFLSTFHIDEQFYCWLKFIAILSHFFWISNHCPISQATNIFPVMPNKMNKLLHFPLTLPAQPRSSTHSTIQPCSCTLYTYPALPLHTPTFYRTHLHSTQPQSYTLGPPYIQSAFFCASLFYHFQLTLHCSPPHSLKFPKHPISTAKTLISLNFPH